MRTLELDVVDWSHSLRAGLPAVPADSTVGALLDEVKEAMVLPEETPYHLLYGGQKLNNVQTLEEIGVQSGEEITIAPEVSAG